MLQGVDGNIRAFDASTNAVDTNGWQQCMILVVATAASATIEVKTGDTATVDTDPATKLTDPDTGQPVDQDTFSLAAAGDTKILTYFGYKRYIKATGTNADVYVILMRNRRTDPAVE